MTASAISFHRVGNVCRDVAVNTCIDALRAKNGAAQNTLLAVIHRKPSTDELVSVLKQLESMAIVVNTLGDVIKTSGVNSVGQAGHTAVKDKESSGYDALAQDFPPKALHFAQWLQAEFKANNPDVFYFVWDLLHLNWRMNYGTDGLCLNVLDREKTAANAVYALVCVCERMAKDYEYTKARRDRDKKLKSWEGQQ